VLEGSQIPAKFAAEQRIDHLMGRLDSLDSNIGIKSAIPSIEDANGVAQDPKSFKAMVAIMQAQMMSEAFDTNDDDNKNSNSMSSFMDSMMMQNPAMAASMFQNNPMMMGAGFMPGMNPQMMSMMATNPAMAALMNGQANPYRPNFFQGIENTSGMVLPVEGKISSEYGHRHHPISGHDHFHSGVDIAAPRGTVIRSPWAGTVVHVGYVQGFGNNTVIVAHENQVQPDGKIIYSVFGHNDKALVQVGEKINAGEVFATVGSEGNSTGPHLHWETRVAAPGIQGTSIFSHQLSHTVDPMSFAQA
jgi:murein DD-endopeptidase MepM/ murein hydrolase activator NlpD